MFGVEIVAKETSEVFKSILRQHGKSVTWLTCSVVALLTFLLCVPGATANGWFDPALALRQVLSFLDVEWPAAGSTVVEWLRSDKRETLMMGIAVAAAVPCVSKWEFGEVIAWVMVLLAAISLREDAFILLFSGLGASLVLALLAAAFSRSSGNDTGYHYLESRGIFEVWLVKGPIQFAFVPLLAPARLWLLLVGSFQVEDKDYAIATGARVVAPGSEGFHAGRGRATTTPE